MSEATDNRTEDQIVIELYARTDKVGSKSTHRVKWDREDWESMTEADREEAMIDEFWNSGLIDWGYEVKP